jgi:hypothetical protein
VTALWWQLGAGVALARCSGRRVHSPVALPGGSGAMVTGSERKRGPPSEG